MRSTGRRAGTGQRSVRRLAVLGVAAVATLTMVTPPVGRHAEAAAVPGVPPATATSYSVTLVTGDRVEVFPRPGGRYFVRVDKGEGRERMTFRTQPTATGYAVIPADALAPLARGALDARLFDVALLREFGYDDAHTDTLPLMTSAPRGARLAPAALPHTTVAHRIPQMGVTSVRAKKSALPDVWTSLTTAGGSLAAGSVARVSLVGKLRLDLHESTKLIGAPRAWAAGHTGTGVTVAVLDNGIDPEHPDLKGVVTGAVDFTGTDPQLGRWHGTHVAGIVAGRGTASGGKYVGVAKGAMLEDVRVCGSSTCEEDAVLAGMSWAAESGAKVVTMSLGAPFTKVDDLLMRAVEQLTAAHGVLFVGSAGNTGFDMAVNSPGAADAAISVASADKSDVWDPWSSRGPRLDATRRFDYAIKPDISAPGVDIVSARASGSAEPPIDEHYVMMSGTSMATPHVAGAAAILAAQHPGWSPGAIKSTLTSTSTPLDGPTVYQQGAGRVDVGRATSQAVTGTGILNLGYLRWPFTQTSPVTSPVTYTNAGPSPVTLDLSLTVHDEAGKPAAEGMFGLGATTVTVRPGATATVDVTVDPRCGAYGLYSGRLVATSADGSVRVVSAVGAYKEVESYDITVSALDRQGRPATDVTLALVNRRTRQAATDSGVDGPWVRRMPAGTYVLTATTTDPGGSGSPADDITTVEAREVVLNRSQDVTLDARKGGPLTVEVDNPQAERHSMDLHVGPASAGVVGLAENQLYTVPTPRPIEELNSVFTAAFAKKGTTGPGQPPTPFTYNVQLVDRTKVHTGRQLVRTADMAVVRQQIYRQSPDEGRSLLNAPSWSTGDQLSLGGLTERIDYFSPGPDAQYTAHFKSGVQSSPGWLFPTESLAGPPRSYSPGEVATAEWNRAVFGPAPRGQRSGDTVHLSPMLLSDPGHVGEPIYSDAGPVTLLKDGVVVAEDTSPSLSTTLPPGKATYTLRASSTRATIPWAELSKRVEATWTFQTERVTGATRNLPLLSVRFTPAVNLDNYAEPGRTIAIPVQVGGADGAPVTALTVEASFDGGATWRAVALTGSGTNRTATITNPGSGTVTLRAKAADGAGNTVEQTIINAYRVGAQYQP